VESAPRPGACGTTAARATVGEYPAGNDTPGRVFSFDTAQRRGRIARVVPLACCCGSTVEATYATPRPGLRPARGVFTPRQRWWEILPPGQAPRLTLARPPRSFWGGHGGTVGGTRPDRTRPEGTQPGVFV